MLQRKDIERSCESGDGERCPMAADFVDKLTVSRKRRSVGYSALYASSCALCHLSGILHRERHVLQVGCFPWFFHQSFKSTRLQVVEQLLATNAYRKAIHLSIKSSLSHLAHWTANRLAMLIECTLSCHCRVTWNWYLQNGVDASLENGHTALVFATALIILA